MVMSTAASSSFLNVSSSVTTFFQCTGCLTSSWRGASPPRPLCARLGSRFAVGTGHLCQIKFWLMHISHYAPVLIARDRTCALSEPQLRSGARFFFRRPARHYLYLIPEASRLFQVGMHCLRIEAQIIAMFCKRLRAVGVVAGHATCLSQVEPIADEVFM